MRRLTIVGAEVDGVAGLGVRVVDGHLAAVGPDVEPASGDEILDARGGAVIPGLHDHHIHLRALAAEAGSLRVGPPDVTARDELATALWRAALDLDPAAWVRVTGYHESVAGELDRWTLDELVDDRPVRVQHRSGMLWVLNGQAIEQTDLASCEHPGVERDHAGEPTGRLWRMDSWIAAATPRVDADLGRASRLLTVFGVTGITDADPHRSAEAVDDIQGALASGDLAQRVHLMGPVDLVVPWHPRLSMGPVKILLDDVDLPDPDTLAATIHAVHERGRTIAVHCVTRVQLVVLLAAIDIAGSRPGDRVEHASVVPPELIAPLAGFGLTVVTQPNLVFERGDQYLSDVAAEDLASLYRCRSLLDAGVVVAAGTDAPFGRPDPWTAMRAAIDRRTADGAELGAGETLPPRRALDLFLGSPSDPGTPRRVEPGGPADLVVLRAPIDEVLSDPCSSAVATTIIGGAVAGEPNP